MRLREPHARPTHQPQFAPVRQLRAGATARRWAIWASQAESGEDPCFATAARFQCRRTTCPWWDECQGLQADWRR